MRVLILTRQPRGGVATFARAISDAATDAGHTTFHLDAIDWMPRETGRPHDRATSAKLRERATGYDAVIAMNYRCAWACAEALGKKKPWIYIAYDLLPTTSSELMDRLNQARCGFSPSRNGRTILESAWAHRVRDLRPWLPKGPLAAREISAQPLIAVLGTRLSSGEKERARDHVRRAADRLGPIELKFTCDEPDRESALRLVASAHLALQPLSGRSFSFGVLEALTMGVPTLVRDRGGLGEMIEHRYSGLLYDDADQLSDSVASALQAPLLLESISEAARHRAEDYFRKSESVETLLKTLAAL